VIRLYLAGFTTEEIGKLMAFSEAKARNILYRGLDALKGQLGLKEASKP
jgi:DNA-directed RNA polymerase specialized sigma24 family protein